MSQLRTLCGVFAVLFVCWGGFFRGCPPPRVACPNGDSDCAASGQCDSCSTCTCGTDGNCDFAAKTCPTGQECDSADGACKTPCGADADCDDTDACTDDSCGTDGFCAAGTATDCDDGVDCTDDSCDSATGCVNSANDANCDDSDACTDDSCDAASGCANTDVVCDAGETCVDGVCIQDCAVAGDCADDADACTDATCVDGHCGTAPKDCDDAVACTDDSCDAATGDCVNADNCPAGSTCDTTTGQCSSCDVDADCDDGNTCTTEVCTNGACLSTNNTSPCDDGNACTTGDACAAGACAAGAAVVCPPGQACNTTTGNCAAIICTSNANCNDGFSCTTDTCNAGTGLCVFTPIDAACDDGKFCNGTEGAGSCNTADVKAEAGTGCVRPGNPCAGVTPVCNEATNACQACTTAAECNDNVPCTSDTCNTGTGACNNVAVNANCPDPLKCDGDDTCTPTVGGAPNPNADVNGCVQPGNPCDAIGKVCNESSFVVGDLNTCTTCVSNADCTDGITCTQDVCSGAPAVCSHAATNSLCPDPAFCNGDDVCAPANPDADANGCINGLGSFLAPGPTYPCPNACNENTNACFACTANAECSDNIACTTDSCNGFNGTCNHINACTGGLLCDLQSGQCK